MTLHPYELEKMGKIGEQFNYDILKMDEINKRAIKRINENSVPELDYQQQIPESNPDYITP